MPHGRRGPALGAARRARDSAPAGLAPVAESRLAAVTIAAGPGTSGPQVDGKDGKEQET
jgi:hypothetical protein